MGVMAERFLITTSQGNVYVYPIKRATLEKWDTALNRKEYLERKYLVTNDSFPLLYVSVYRVKGILLFYCVFTTGYSFKIVLYILIRNLYL